MSGKRALRSLVHGRRHQSLSAASCIARDHRGHAMGEGIALGLGFLPVDSHLARRAEHIYDKRVLQCVDSMREVRGQMQHITSSKNDLSPCGGTFRSERPFDFP